MTQKPKSRVQALIEVAEGLLKLPAPNPDKNMEVAKIVLAEMRNLQKKAKAALKMPSGNPNMAEAAEKGRAVRREKAYAHAAVIQAIIERLRSNGCTTYRDLAKELNETDFKSPTGGKWHAASVRAAELRKP